VALAEATAELGGRVSRESRLPGLSAWARVRDYRAGQIAKMVNVTVYRESALTAEDVLGFGFAHVAVATGAAWRRDGVARYHTLPLPVDKAARVLTPDDLMGGGVPTGGHVVLYDDDHYYMGSVLAELLVQNGCRVSFLTPASRVADWSFNTLEQGLIQSRLLERGVEIACNRAVMAVGEGNVETACTYTGRTTALACDAVVLVTSRLPVGSLYRDLKARQAEWSKAGILSVKAIGDAQAPAAIAWATYAGHRYAEELDEPDRGDALPFRREVAGLKV
jgi:dimethylamine/trimethylamine dehydrogenase